MINTGSGRTALLLYGPSTDGDLAGLNCGDFDATLLVFGSEYADVDRTALEFALNEARALDNQDGKYTELSYAALQTQIMM